MIVAYKDVITPQSQDNPSVAVTERIHVVP